MTLFPKTPRFPPEKGSDVPSPGRYNPLLHDPTQDPWRKGPLEIFKAPRSKEPDHGPDTFGLYNPDAPHDNIHGSRPRPRAISTLATPSKHHKELLRLESKLSERESNITHLTEALNKSEKTMKEIRNALNKSETENTTLHTEVERLRKQLQGIAGLHTKFTELESEHDKSKKKRDKEISHLRAELRLAEDRASRYLNEKETLADDFKRFQHSVEDSEKSLHSVARRNNQVLAECLQKLIEDRHASNRALQFAKDLSRLDDIQTNKNLADRASQVTELVSLVSQANSREDLLYELLDDILETYDLQTTQSLELVNDLQSERGELQNCLIDFKAEMKCRHQLSDELLREKDIELELARQQTSIIELKLNEACLVSSSVEKSLIESTQAYSNLSGVCHSQTKELNRVQDELAKRNGEIAQLKKSIQAQESQIVDLNHQVEEVKEKHSVATEAWHLKEDELQSGLKKFERDLKEEKERRNKISAEMMLARQAEAALIGEAEYARNLKMQIEETEQQNERLKKLNDLIIRKSKMNAMEVEKVEKLNTELASQQNPAQKVRVLDRMRKEIKEEKENTAKLENQLWAANSEIKSLKDELSAYQSVSHPKSTSTMHTIIGTSRVTRPPLTEVVKQFEIQPTIQAIEDTNEQQSDSKVTMRKKTKPHPPPSSNPDTLSRAVKPAQSAADVAVACRLPITQKNHQKLMRKRDDLMKDKPVITNTKNFDNNGEMSLGAIKMQGKMTLDELL